MEVIQLILPYVFGYKFVMSYIVYILKKKKKKFLHKYQTDKKLKPKKCPLLLNKGTSLIFPATVLTLNLQWLCYVKHVWLRKEAQCVLNKLASPGRD